MEILWKFDLPTDESIEDYHYEGPIFVQGDNLYYICKYLTNHKHETILYIVDKTSGEMRKTFCFPKKTTIPSKYFFELCGDKIIIYTGTLWLLHEGHFVELLDQEIDGEINSHFIYENYFVFADRTSVYCIDTNAKCLKWKSNLPNTKNYSVGDVSLFENSISCYGNDQLLFLDVTSGNILNRIKVPRVDKLFNPIRMKDGSLLIGFTNWSNAGILRYDVTLKKVIWKSSRSFEGPLLRRKIFMQNDLAYWVKNDTELVCVNIDNGNEVFRTKTDPWLYTDLMFLNERVYYGTAGRGGFLVSLNAKNGTRKWAHPLKNGCAYFDLHCNSAVVGDYEKKIYQIDLTTGKILQEILVDGEVVGRIKVYQNDAYTVIWGKADQPIRLIKLKI
ncbi:MAG: PQQ-like beta-propeller repeat protein [Clostridia bacterium]|nr:PQQ-like beta-propeller repeat protein [Clostridia bacterium]